MRKFGLFGYPLSHSFSRKFFTEKFEREDLADCVYENFETQNIYDLKKIVVENPDLVGLNVTIPYKQDVIPMLDNLDDISQRIGAVNCVVVDAAGAGLHLDRADNSATSVDLSAAKADLSWRSSGGFDIKNIVPLYEEAYNQALNSSSSHNQP